MGNVSKISTMKSHKNTIRSGRSLSKWNNTNQSWCCISKFKRRITWLTTRSHNNCHICTQSVHTTQMSERNVNTGMRKKLVSLENFLKDKKPRIINSPRSLEACLRQGLDPAELIPKSLAQFQAEENLREVAQVKFEHHEERRNEKMEQARAERAVIVNFLEEARKSGSTRLSPSFQKLAAASAPSESGVSVAGSGNDEMESSMLREEMKRVDMLRKRQQKDIEQMMSFEMNIVKMQKEQKRLEEMEEQKKHVRRPTDV